MLVVHAAATWCMVGVIWFVQLDPELVHLLLSGNWLRTALPTARAVPTAMWFAR